MIKGRASKSRSNCIPLYVSYDGKPSDRAFAAYFEFPDQEKDAVNMNKIQPEVE